MKRHFVSMVTVLTLACSFAAAEEAATTKPAGVVLKASDKEGLEKNKDKEVTVEGTISEAAWSKTGKVMNIHFEGADDSGFVAVVFQREKGAFDKAFDGDAAKTLTGAKVTVTGKVGTYHDKPQIILNKPSQVAVAKETAQSATAAKPAEKTEQK